MNTQNTGIGAITTTTLSTMRTKLDEAAAIARAAEGCAVDTIAKTAGRKRAFHRYFYVTPGRYAIELSIGEVPVGLADEAWRSDHEGCFGMRITEPGLRAIGVPVLESGLTAGPGGWNGSCPASCCGPSRASGGSTVARARSSCCPMTAAALGA